MTLSAAPLASAPAAAMEIPDFLRVKPGQERPAPSPQLLAVLQLSKAEALRVWQKCHDRDPSFPAPQSGENESDDSAWAKGLLLQAVRRGASAQVELVMAVVRERDADGITEKLIGKTIQRLPEAGKHAPRKPRAEKQPRPGQTFQGDDQIIRLVAEGNPRKPGTRAAMLYALYRDGMTVAEYVAAGGGRGNVKCDCERGNIRLDPAAKKGG